MFSYYGSKAKIINHYPSAKFQTIIEPFAGSARYALRDDNWQKNVIISDTFDIVYKLWKYLQKASIHDIMSLPEMEFGDKVDAHKDLCEEAKYLIGFCINRGSRRPQNTASYYNYWEFNKIDIAFDVEKIRHWTILNDSYEKIPNQEATWFIDAPYSNKFGKSYVESNKKIDFQKLGEWCKSRKGQVIVCENIDATWLPFKPLKMIHGQSRDKMEAIYYQET